MKYENDFVKEDIVDLKIDDKIFKYKPITAGEENSWLNEYTVVVDGIAKQDHAALNKCKMRNLIAVPYDKDIIKAIINIDKAWEQLTPEERWSLLKKLKPKVFSEIIIAIDKIDNSEEKKN